MKKEGDIKTPFDKWLYKYQELSKFEGILTSELEQEFQLLFESAELAKFSPKEKQAYDNRLKWYRDFKNVLDTAFEAGKKAGLMKARMMKEMEIKTDTVINALKINKLSVEEIAKYFDLSIEFVLDVKDSHNL